MKKYLKVYILLLPIIFFFLIQFIFNVRVKFSSQYGDYPVNVSSGSLFKVKKEINKYILSDLKIIDSTIKFNLPNILLVNVVVKKPVFAIYDTTQKKYFLLDESGVILSVADENDLPYIKQSGDKINLFALNLIKLIHDLYSVQYAEIKDDTILVDMEGGVKVIFPIEGNYKTQFVGMQLIYKKINEDYYGRFKEIDLRFVNPVLR